MTVEEKRKSEDVIVEILGAVYTSREMALSAINLGGDQGFGRPWMQKVRDLAILMAYEDNRVSWGGRSRRRVVVEDMDGLLAEWIELIVTLATVHDHEARTKADGRTDDLLRPLLTAPIAQVREFTQRLAAMLEADPRVPWATWSGVKRIVLPVVLKGKEGKEEVLRGDLAWEVAEMTEAALDRQEIIASMAGALQWRGAEDLKRVRDALQTGGKPRLRGRES